MISALNTVTSSKGPDNQLISASKTTLGATSSSKQQFDRLPDKGDSGEDNERNSDEDRSRKRRRRGSQSSKNISAKSYACHFYKKRPLFYSGPGDWELCGKPSFKEVYRLKYVYQLSTNQQASLKGPDRSLFGNNLPYH